MKNTGLIVRDDKGRIVGVTLCNEKSRNKTVERGELWVVDPDTGRVLPFAGGGKAVTGGISDHGKWYEITLGGNTLSGPADGSVTDPENTVQPDNWTEPVVKRSAEGNVEQIGTVLAELTEIITERHRTMPEGSYTTHLFTKGSSKIRKKTGEEAVELILANNKDELTSEAADLIYHLMVLLEAESLTIGDVIDVLAHRF